MSNDDRSNLQALLTQDRPLRELGAIYEQGRARIAELVTPLDDHSAAMTVPATPEWSVHGVLAHLTGLCADVLAGNIDGAGTDAWTAAQVDARRDDTIADLLAEWDDVGARFATLLDDFPGRICMQPVADITVHEHDLRGALNRPGSRHSEGMDVALDFLAEVFLLPGVAALGLGPLEVRADGRRWVGGTDGDGSGDLEAAWQAALRSTDEVDPPEVAPAGTLSLEPFELFRALTGRRSAAQIRRFDWTVDPGPYLPVFGFGPFTVRATDLME